MSNTKKKIGIILTVVVLVGCFIAGLTWHNQKPYLSGYPTITSQRNQNKLPRDSKHLTYVLYYRPTCKDCEHVHPLIKRLSHSLPRGSKLYLVNAHNAHIKDEALRKGIDATPTLMVYYHGILRYHYSGTSKQTLTALFHGYTPSHQKLTNLNSTVVQNDFQHVETTTELIHEKPALN